MYINNDGIYISPNAKFYNHNDDLLLTNSGVPYSGALVIDTLEAQTVEPIKIKHSSTSVEDFRGVIASLASEAKEIWEESEDDSDEAYGRYQAFLEVLKVWDSGL